MTVRTVKVTPLDALPFTLTTTLPVVAPEGTTVVIEVALQFEIVATVPLKVTVLVPCDAPKFVPVMITDVPTTPDVEDRLLIVGCASIVKGTPLDARLFTVTTTLPVAAPDGTTAVIDVGLQFEIEVAVAPLKVTELVPCVAPKFVPVMFTVVPASP